MLVIAIGYGSLTDPFTTSINASVGDIDPDDAEDCRAFICKEQGLRPQWIDEILIVDYDRTTSSDPKVIHQYGELADLTEDEENEDE